MILFYHFYYSEIIDIGTLFAFLYTLLIIHIRIIRLIG